MEARAPRAGGAGTRTMGVARPRRRCARVKASRGGPGYPRAGRPRAEADPDGAETIGDIPRPAWWSTVAYELDTLRHAARHRRHVGRHRPVRPAAASPSSCRTPG